MGFIFESLGYLFRYEGEGTEVRMKMGGGGVGWKESVVTEYLTSNSGDGVN